MTDRIISIIALAGFGLFLGILGYWVREIDLIVVLAIGFVLCAWDFWRAARADSNGK